MEIRLSNLLALEKRKQHFVHSMQLCFPCKGLVKVTSMLLSWKNLFDLRFFQQTIFNESIERWSNDDLFQLRTAILETRLLLSIYLKLDYRRSTHAHRSTLFSSNCSPIFGQKEAERKKFEHFSTQEEGDTKCTELQGGSKCFFT